MLNKPRLAMISDGVNLTTGFAQVTKMVLPAFLNAGWDVSHFAIMDTRWPDTTSGLGYWHWPTRPGDEMGYADMLKFLTTAVTPGHKTPDVIFMIGDPGTIYQRLSQLANVGYYYQDPLTGQKKWHVPIMIYAPIEGAPISSAFARAFEWPSWSATYTEWGRMELYDEHTVITEALPHGADHDDFRPLPKEVRTHIRRILDLEDKFIVGIVATNKRTNRYPALIQAMGILLKRGYNNIYLYTHCKFNEANIATGGWNLDDCIMQYRAYHETDEGRVSHVLYPTKYLNKSPWYGQLSGNNATITIDELMQMPSTPLHNRAEILRILNSMDYIALLNIFDLYIDPASAHGWNLPLIECMRCGVPCITVDDGFARSDIYKDVAFMMKPSTLYYDYWHTTAQLPLVSPWDIADAIEKMYNDADAREYYAQKGKTFADGMSWQPTVNRFIEVANSLLRQGK